MAHEVTWSTDVTNAAYIAALNEAKTNDEQAPYGGLFPLDDSEIDALLASITDTQGEMDLRAARFAAAKAEHNATMRELKNRLAGLIDKARESGIGADYAELSKRLGIGMGIKVCNEVPEI